MKNYLQKSKLIKFAALSLAVSGIFVLFVLATPQAFAAIAQRGTATTATVTNNASLTIAKPTGVVSGDVIIANLVQVNSLTPPTAPTGWTLIDHRSLAGTTNRYASIFYKVAGASEGTSYTFTVPTGSSVTATGGIVAFSGVNPTTPFDVTPGTIQVNDSVTVTTAGITTASANAVVVMLGQAAGTAPTWSGWTTTSPGALTEILDFHGTNTTVGAAWGIKATAGATGNGTATLSGSERNGGILIALKPLVPSTGTIQITKHTTGGDGTFSFPINGSSTATSTVTTSGNTGSSATTVNVGTYSVKETIPGGWILASASCSNGTFNGVDTVSGITVSTGQTVTCTFNDTKLPVLTVAVLVSGGTAHPSDFTINVSGLNVNANPASFSGNASGTAVTVSPNAVYSIGESSVANYTPGTSGACSGSLAPGATATCTITETYVPPVTTGTLHLALAVDNTAGGSAISSNFTVTVSGANAAPSSFGGNAGGTAVTVDGGASYTVGASSQPNYTFSQSGNCTGPIAAGNSDTCTVTETYSPAPIPTSTLNVFLVVDNSRGGAATPSSFTITVGGGTPTTFAGNASGTAVVVDADTSYTVGASSLANYTATPSGNCAGPIAANTADSCTITETYGTLIPPVTGNLILNADMQTSTATSSAPDNWTGLGYGTNDRTFTYPVGGPGGVGDKAAQATINSYTDGDAKWVFDPVSVTPGALDRKSVV
jgi:hypothetical protein